MNETARWPVVTSCQSGLGDMEDQGVRAGAEILEVYSCRQSLGQIYDGSFVDIFVAYGADFLFDLY